MDQICGSIVQALSAIQSPYSTSEERHRASQAIEDLKRQTDCASYMLHILQQSGQLSPHQDESETIRFLSLKVLEDWMINFWNSSSIDMQLEVLYL
jgi:hypothetical protein